MEVDIDRNALYHHGTKGQKWGVRRFQNKDGSLTKAGQKRYDKETKDLKSEKRVLRNKVRTQKKIDKLNSLKKDVDDMEKTVKNKETDEARRARVLNSTDPKEIYKNRDVLSTFELNDRINRIDTEARLQSKIVEEHVQTGMEKMNDKMRSTTNTINNTKNLFNSVDQAYSSVANSAIGKTLAKKLGLEPPKKEFNLDDFWKNRNKKTTQEMRDVYARLTAEEGIRKKMDAEKAAKETMKKAKKEVDDYNKNWYENDNAKSKNDPGPVNKETAKEYTRSTKNDKKNSTSNTRTPLLDEPVETFKATYKDVVGEGTSRYKKKSGPIIDADYYDVPMDGMPERYERSGQKFLESRKNNTIGLLEDRNKK